MTGLFDQLEAAVLRRNPGYRDGLQPPLPREDVQQQLKRIGLKECAEPLVAWYGWRNGARFVRECDASNLGIAPPSFLTPDPKNIAFLQGLGHKINVPQKIYDEVVFHDFDAGVRHV